MRRIVRLMRHQLPQIIHNHTNPLHQNCTPNYDRIITIKNEILNILRQGQNQRLTQSQSQVLKSCMLLGPPAKSDILLCRPSQRNRYLEEILNKPQIVTCQPKESPNVRWIPQNLPPHHGLDLGRIDQNTIMVDKVP